MRVVSPARGANVPELAEILQQRGRANHRRASYNPKMAGLCGDLPGQELIATGLADLSAGIESVPALLVAIGMPRLSRLGLAVPAGPDRPEHRLYALLSAADPDGAHSRYNALIRRLVSFERALECAS